LSKKILLKNDFVIVVEDIIDRLQVLGVFHELFDLGILNIRQKALLVVLGHVDLPAVEERILQLELSLESPLLDPLERELWVALPNSKLLINNRKLTNFTGLDCKVDLLGVWWKHVGIAVVLFVMIYAIFKHLGY
jgi:hypothetical protein